MKFDCHSNTSTEKIVTLSNYHYDTDQLSILSDCTVLLSILSDCATVKNIILSNFPHSDCHCPTVNMARKS